MSLPVQEQANAVYFLFKERKQQFLNNLAKTDIFKMDIFKMDTLEKDWQALNEIATEYSRLQKLADSERK